MAQLVGKLSNHTVPCGKDHGLESYGNVCLCG